jgi:hypothetical protein
MFISAWLKQRKTSGDIAGWALLVVALAWAGFRFARSLQLLFAGSHDLYTYYSLWYVMCHREMADIALRQSLYLPHTWFFLTPLFAFGWPVARALVLVLNLGCVGFLWWRLSALADLRGVRKALLLAFSLAWLSTGLVIGLGNLALVCVAAVVAAFPYQSPPNQIFLAFSAMKQTLVFPVYLLMVIRRPRALIIPFSIFAVSGVAALIWARLMPLEAVAMARSSLAAVGSWTQFDHTCLRRILVLFTSNPLWISLLNWAIWFGLFGASLRFLRDPLSQLAALMLLSLLPVYHNTYDMVAALPVLAVFLRRSGMVLPALLTLGLSINLAASLTRILPGSLKGAAQALESAYYPLLILACLAALFYLERGVNSGEQTRAGALELEKPQEEAGSRLQS